MAADPTLPAPFRWEGGHITGELPGARVLFSTRRGGVSPPPFASLNLGRLTDDDGANVDENRARLAAAVGAPRERFLHGRQVHEATVRRATEPPGPQRPHAEEDGQATALADAPALVFVADCLPVMLVADGAVAALHGGWRGLAAGIVAEGVAALRELGADGPVQAALGPSARGCCYEVGEEVHAAFDGHDARVAARNLDLAKVARQQLEAAGVEAVHDVGLCTMCADGELFFSHRRDGGVTGRQAGVVWRA
jgi:purine-nucleoside/S-methyl-5'-thioadenosine phosphorylase / adenosine deaminase